MHQQLFTSNDFTVLIMTRQRDLNHHDIQQVALHSVTKAEVFIRRTSGQILGTF
jgi:hypothetical protein